MLYFAKWWKIDLFPRQMFFGAKMPLKGVWKCLEHVSMCFKHFLDTKDDFFYHYSHIRLNTHFCVQRRSSNIRKGILLQQEFNANIFRVWSQIVPLHACTVMPWKVLVLLMLGPLKQEQPARRQILLPRIAHTKKLISWQQKIWIRGLQCLKRSRTREERGKKMYGPEQTFC